MYDFLWPHGMQHAMPPCPSRTPGGAQTHVHWVGDAIHPSRPLLSPSPPAFNLFQVFSNKSVLHIRWPEDWSFSVSPANEHSGLISFQMVWLDLVVQGTLKSLFKHHSLKASIQKKNSKKKIKASILQHSAFFIVQLSRPYMTTGKTITLTGWAVVGKTMSLLFNMLSRLVIAFLPRSKRLLISWLQAPSHSDPAITTNVQPGECCHLRCLPTSLSRLLLSNL